MLLLLGSQDSQKSMGGGGGVRKVLSLQPGEYITEVSGRYGSLVDSITTRTSRSQTMTWGGLGGVKGFDYQAPPGTQIVGFWGRSGQLIDAIGVLMATPYSV
jgi:Jacalin-like lectin domain